MYLKVAQWRKAQSAKDWGEHGRGTIHQDLFFNFECFYVRFNVFLCVTSLGQISVVFVMIHVLCQKRYFLVCEKWNARQNIFRESGYSLFSSVCFFDITPLMSPQIFGKILLALILGTWRFKSRFFEKIHTIVFFFQLRHQL